MTKLERGIKHMYVSTCCHIEINTFLFNILVYHILTMTKNEQNFNVKKSILFQYVYVSKQAEIK